MSHSQKIENDLFAAISGLADGSDSVTEKKEKSPMVRGSAGGNGEEIQEFYQEYDYDDDNQFGIIQGGSPYDEDIKSDYDANSVRPKLENFDDEDNDD